MFLPTRMEEVLELTSDLESGEKFLASVPCEDFDTWKVNNNLQDDRKVQLVARRPYFVDIMVTRNGGLYKIGRAS